MKTLLALLLLIPSFSFANAEYSKFIEVKILSDALNDISVPVSLDACLKLQ